MLEFEMVVRGWSFVVSQLRSITGRRRSPVREYFEESI